MALGRISIKVGKVGKAKPHYNYITASDKYENKQDEILYIEHRNIPNFADSAEKFWAFADKYERKNGSTYREHILTLPRELTLEQNKKLVNQWVEQEIGDKLALSLAIHSVKASDGLEQMHCHLMFNERQQDEHKRTAEQFFKRYNSKDPSRGGAKKINTGMKAKERKEQLLQQRKRWQDTVNAHLENANVKQRVDLRSHYHKNKDKTHQTQRPINLHMREFEQYKNDILNSKITDYAEFYDLKSYRKKAYENKTVAEFFKHRKKKLKFPSPTLADKLRIKGREKELQQELERQRQIKELQEQQQRERERQIQKEREQLHHSRPDFTPNFRF